MNTPQNPMTREPENSMLVRMAAPISMGMLSTFLFQIVDTYFVGQLGSAEMAALAFSSTAYLVFCLAIHGAIGRCFGGCRESRRFGAA